MKKYIPLFSVFILIFSIHSNGQNKDSITFYTQIGITNNGISTVPNFSLNKPAFLTNFSLIKGQFSFDPQILLSAELKPWQYNYRVHYLLIDKERFKLVPGAALSYSYNIADVSEGGVDKSIIKGNSYYNFELAGSYIFNKHISITPFYLYGNSREKSGAGILHYISVITTYQNLRLGGNLNASISPQLYYLILNNLNGYFASFSASLNSSKSPFSFSGIINTPLGNRNTVAGDLVWSLGLNWAFQKTFFYKK